jgi:hypothetical protein
MFESLAEFPCKVIWPHYLFNKVVLKIIFPMEISLLKQIIFTKKSLLHLYIIFMELC